MESTEYLLKTIAFSRKGLKLEDIIRLIYFAKKFYELDEDLHSIIASLRKYSKYIRYIGYDNEADDIRVQFLFDLKRITLDEINSIGC